MRVLHINAVYGQGSTGVIVQDIHNMALQNGIDSYVAYAHPNRKVDEKNTYIIGNKFDHKLHAMLSRINGRQAYFSRIPTKRLLRKIDELKPNIVHLHNLHSNYINLNMLLQYLADKHISTVITLHDCWFFTGGCFHYTKVNCCKWLTTCGKCPKKKVDTPAYILDKSKFILEDRKKYLSQIEDLTVVGVSEWITQEAKKSFLNNAKLLTIYNGVDLEFFKPVKSNFREQYNLENKFLILGMANKWFEPANAELLKTFSERIDEDSVLIIIGGTKEQRERLSSKVIGIPYVTNREELREIYSACDVFVNCTREDTLGSVNIEAQACGTPVIVFSNTGTKETIDSVSGYCVPDGNVECMLEMVQNVKENGKAHYSDICQRYVHGKFERNTNYAKYMQLYKKLY